MTHYIRHTPAGSPCPAYFGRRTDTTTRHAGGVPPVWIRPLSIEQSSFLLRFDWSGPRRIFPPHDASVARVAIPVVEFALHYVRWDAFRKRIARQSGRYPSDVPETRYALGRITVDLILYRCHAITPSPHVAQYQSPVLPRCHYVSGPYSKYPILRGPMRALLETVRWPRLLPR